jgi:hypothetical protein
MAEI